MYSAICSGALQGISAYLVLVEVDIAQGLPAFSMVGSLGCEVRESRERVCVALKNVGLELPPKRITVNLAPADRRKEGTAFDLPIAVGVLEGLSYIPVGAGTDRLFLGELGLNGEVKRARGVLPIVREAAARGVKECIVPAENAREGAAVSGITVRGVADVGQLLAFLQAASGEEQEKILPGQGAADFLAEDLSGEGQAKEAPDFGEVAGQETAKRAAEIAAAGFHNLLLVGPPGAGKSMIARRIPGIMPALTLAESEEVTSIASVAGLMGEGKRLVTKRPFCSPHHTITQAALVGGSHIPRPGVVSLAHRGVLFLDELPEFKREALDSLRQPLEEHQVHVARVGGNVTYPSDFMLVCAMNPCPCGYYPDRNRCRCTNAQVKQYMGKVSGPILDRIDLCVELQPVELDNLKRKGGAEKSSVIRERVQKARRRQEMRFAGTGTRFNGDIESGQIDRYCPLGAEEEVCMEQLYHSLHLSARAFHRILKVARTIADLGDAEEIRVDHLLEASYYRPTQEYWQI